MASARKPRKEPPAELPPPGSAFVFEVRDGQLGLCRVLRHTEGAEARFMGRGALVTIMIAMPCWRGRPPATWRTAASPSWRASDRRDW